MSWQARRKTDRPRVSCRLTPLAHRRGFSPIPKPQLLGQILKTASQAMQGGVDDVFEYRGLRPSRPEPVVSREKGSAKSLVVYPAPATCHETVGGRIYNLIFRACELEPIGRLRNQTKRELRGLNGISFLCREA